MRTLLLVMALSTATGSFNITTGAAASTVVVSGLNSQSTWAAGDTPKCVLFWWNGRTEATDGLGRATHHRGFGFAASTTSRYAVGSNSQDAQGTAESRSGIVNTGCILEVTLGANTVAGAADLQSFDTDGFTLVIDDQFVTDLRIHYLALGGSSLTNALAGEFTPTGVAPTTQAVTGVGFQPDLVFFISPSAALTINTFGADSCHCFGVMNGANGEAVWAGGSNFGSNTMLTIGYSRRGECIARYNAPASGTQDRAEFSAFGSDGFTINWLERAGAGVVAYLAVKGLSSVVGDLLTLNDTVTAITETGFGFPPSAVVFVSAVSSENGADAPHDHDRASFGLASSATQRQCVAWFDEDAIGTSEVTTATKFDAVYINISGASAIDGLMDVQSFDSDGFTCIMDDADPGAAAVFVWYVALGVASAAAFMPPPGVLVSQAVNRSATF